MYSDYSKTSFREWEQIIQWIIVWKTNAQENLNVDVLTVRPKNPRLMKNY